MIGPDEGPIVIDMRNTKGVPYDRLVRENPVQGKKSDAAHGAPLERLSSHRARLGGSLVTDPENEGASL